jgi:2'-5' RNA ligase
MRQDRHVPSVRGESAVVVPVPAVEPAVSRWRARFDDSAAQGMPAHVTAVYPFLSEDRLTASVRAELLELCADLPVLDVVFARLARFPRVLYLDPDPADGLRRLTLTIAERWPEAPPYGGRFAATIPHLTIAHDVDDDVMANIDRGIRSALPVRASLHEARLCVFDGARWESRADLPFQGAAATVGKPWSRD